jgi:hypothetical protein
VFSHERRDRLEEVWRAIGESGAGVYTEADYVVLGTEVHERQKHKRGVSPRNLSGGKCVVSPDNDLRGFQFEVGADGLDGRPLCVRRALAEIDM